MSTNIANIFIIAIIIKGGFGCLMPCLHYDETNKLTQISAVICKTDFKNFSFLDGNGKQLVQCNVADNTNVLDTDVHNFTLERDRLGLFHVSFNISTSWNQGLVGNYSLIVDNNNSIVIGYKGSKDIALEIIETSINNENALYVVCSACYHSRYNHAEFNIIAATETQTLSVVYDPKNNSCGCKPYNCSCGTNGRSFAVELPMPQNETRYECSMSLNINGKAILSHASQNRDRKETTVSRSQIQVTTPTLTKPLSNLILILVSCIAGFVLLAICTATCFCCYKKKAHKKGVLLEEPKCNKSKKMEMKRCGDTGEVTYWNATSDPKVEIVSERKTVINHDMLHDTGKREIEQKN